MRPLPLVTALALTCMTLSCQHQSDGARSSAIPANTNIYFETENTSSTIKIQDFGAATDATVNAYSFAALEQNAVTGQWTPTPAFLASKIPYPAADLIKLVAASYAQAVQSQKLLESDAVLTRFHVAPRATSDYVIKLAALEVRDIQIPGSEVTLCSLSLKVQAWHRMDEALAAVGTANLTDINQPDQPPHLLLNKPACVLYAQDDSIGATQPILKADGKTYFMSIQPETISELVKVAITRLQIVSL